MWAVVPFGGGGGFFLPCQDFGRMFDNLFLDWAFFFFFLFFKVEIRSRTLIPLFRPGSVYSSSSSEKTVAECSVTSCVWALFLIVSYLVLSAQSATKDYVRAEHKLQSISTLSISQVIIHKSYFWAYLYSAGTQHGNLHPAGWPILFCGPTQERKKTGRGFGKKCMWMDRKGRNKQGRNPWQ